MRVFKKFPEKETLKSIRDEFLKKMEEVGPSPSTKDFEIDKRKGGELGSPQHFNPKRCELIKKGFRILPQTDYSAYRGRTKTHYMLADITRSAISELLKLLEAKGYKRKKIGTTKDRLHNPTSDLWIFVETPPLTANEAYKGGLH